MLLRIKKEIRSTIRKSAPIYNNGNIVGCEKVYTNLLNAMLDPSNSRFPNLKSNLPRIHQQLLNTKENLLQSDNSNVRTSTSDSNAWKLRHCFDRIVQMV